MRTIDDSIQEERLRLAFASTKIAFDDTGFHAEMPDKLADKLADDAEQDLYLVQAGKYTVADIPANVNTSPSENTVGSNP